MQLLNSHENIHVSPELMFRHPVKKDLYGSIAPKIEERAPVDEIVAALFNFKERLPYTKTINSIGRKLLKEKISKLKKPNTYDIFQIILFLAAKVRQKKIYGAKFAWHFSYTNQLVKHFPDCKIIYLTRDPRAIFISDFKKKKRESKGPYYRFPVKGFFLRIIVLFYIMREWNQSIQEYESCIAKYGSDRVRIFPYEHIIYDQGKVVDWVADFLQCSSEEFNPEEIKVVDSSYENGLSKDRWRQDIRSLENMLYKWILGKKMKRYGYL